METIKNLKFDYHSLYLNEKDAVNVVQKDLNPDGTFKDKTYSAFFMGMRQFNTYSPWMYVFGIKNKDGSIEMKYVNPSEVKEINYKIKAPDTNMLVEAKKDEEF